MDKKTLEKLVYEAYLEGIEAGYEDAESSMRPIPGGLGIQGPVDPDALWRSSDARQAVVGALSGTSSGAEPAVTTYQYREIGEGQDWKDCSKMTYDALSRDPHMDTRMVSATPSPAQEPGAVGADHSWQPMHEAPKVEHTWIFCLVPCAGLGWQARVAVWLVRDNECGWVRDGILPPVGAEIEFLSPEWFRPLGSLPPYPYATPAPTAEACSPAEGGLSPSGRPWMGVLCLAYCGDERCNCECSPYHPSKTPGPAGRESGL